ncbi:hypothetical protein [Clostridium butyricum]|uniref:hypothetical protein n=1 Tax=Clostridium butyricum TaxID=1492 RepID=UPI0018A9CE1A|nr:hypothetical protein [Clostridium butyricum]
MYNKQSIEQLKEICKPIVEWLKENYGPYYTVVITDEHIRIVRDEVGIPIETAQEVPVQEQLIEKLKYLSNSIDSAISEVVQNLKSTIDDKL